MVIAYSRHLGQGCQHNLSILDRIRDGLTWSKFLIIVNWSKTEVVLFNLEQFEPDHHYDNMIVTNLSGLLPCRLTANQWCAEVRRSPSPHYTTIAAGIVTWHAIEYLPKSVFVMQRLSDVRSNCPWMRGSAVRCMVWMPSDPIGSLTCVSIWSVPHHLSEIYNESFV